MYWKMDDITGRLQQLERMEIDLLDERKSVASQRLNEDYDLKERRAREDENWAERLRRKDQEEAVCWKSIQLLTLLVG